MSQNNENTRKHRTSAEILAETSTADVLAILAGMGGTPEAKQEAAEMETKFSAMLTAKQFIPEGASAAYDTAVAIFGESLKRAQEKAQGTRNDAIALLRHVIRETWSDEQIATALRVVFFPKPAETETAE